MPPFVVLGRTSRVDRGEVAFMPTFPELIIKFAVGVIVMSPEVFVIVEEEPPISSFACGLVVPIPIFPLLAMKSLVVSPASPPTDVWKLRLPPFKTLKSAEGFAPVGTANERLPEMEAVGEPPAMFMNANLADAVAVPPKRKSSVVLFWIIILREGFSVNGLVPTPVLSVPQVKRPVESVFNVQVAYVGAISVPLFLIVKIVLGWLALTPPVSVALYTVDCAASAVVFPPITYT